MPLVAIRGMEWTKKYGLSEYSPVSFASTGDILAGALDDLQNGASYGKAAIALMEKVKSARTKSRTMMLTYSMVLHFTIPLNETLKPLLRAYEIGMQTGDTVRCILFQ